MKKAIVIILILVVISNLPYVKTIPIFFGDFMDYEYATTNGEFTFSEMNFKSRDYQMLPNRYTSFRNTGNPDTIIYRITWNNPLKFWRYYDYMTVPKCRLPYMSWKEIEARRGRVENLSGFQDF
jgi:hypothetical protein